MQQSSFDWDDQKNVDNLAKHGVDFENAQYAFLDPYRLIVHDANTARQKSAGFALARSKIGF